jgi:hypothetical protein
MRVYEIEIGASLGTTTAGGQPCSRHRMTVSYSDLDGFMRVSAKDGVTYVATRRMDDTTGWDLLQYLAADGSPTGEFIMEAAGNWDYIQQVSPTTGIKALLATRRDLIRARSETSFDVLTGEGKFVRTCTVPTSIFSNLLVCLANNDAIFTGGYQYGATYGSFDLGVTWQQFTVWGARGSARPPLVPPNSPDLEQLALTPPLFPT